MAGTVGQTVSYTIMTAGERTEPQNYCMCEEKRPAFRSENGPWQRDPVWDQASVSGEPVPMA